MNTLQQMFPVMYTGKSELQLFLDNLPPHLVKYTHQRSYAKFRNEYSDLFSFECGLEIYRHCLELMYQIDQDNRRDYEQRR